MLLPISVQVEPQPGGNYALVSRLGAEQARQRQLVQRELLAPASQLVLQVGLCIILDISF